MSIDMAINCLNTAIDNLDSQGDQQDKTRKISFMVEQLQLLTKSKFGCQYSPQLTIFAYMFYASSSAAYNVVREENVMCLPSVNTLRKVTRRLNTSDGLDNKSYLKLRASKLNQFQRHVLLMIDEIYIAKRVEYSRGAIQGLTPDGSVATILLCFMVKSIAGKYKDIVAIYPMSKLTAAKQHDCYKEVVALLQDVSLNLVGISVDNASTNRKFFVDFLCGGKLQTCVTEPLTGQPVFLIFDPVHDLKNVYNNFQSRKIFNCPPMISMLDNECSANFNHIVELYNFELTMSLRKAHKIGLSTLDPKSIEKTSTKLAVSVFCESTRDALEFYAEHEGKQAWTGTAQFISLILKLWNVMNVKSTSKGRRKRDNTMDPVRSSTDWKINFLRQFAEFLQQWENSKKPGLTRETFLALRHTCLALADCASHLLDHHGFSYILLGQLQSDAIESRFGWFRQLSGANYYISMRQVLESDTKIRALSLLKFSKISLCEIDDAILSSEPRQENSASGEDITADAITARLQLQKYPSASDANVIFYVAGYLGRSVVRSTKCEHCKEVLISADGDLDPLKLDEELNYEASTFFNSINRGGLSKPSDFTFMLTVHCWRVFEEIKSSTDLLDSFLKSKRQQVLFCKIMERSLGGVSLENMFASSSFCTKGHDLREFIVRRFFNCVSKNLVKDITAEANKNSRSQPQKSQKRKIAKLSSSSKAN